jgi:hypothetical protein
VAVVDEGLGVVDFVFVNRLDLVKRFLLVLPPREIVDRRPALQFVVERKVAVVAHRECAANQMVQEDVVEDVLAPPKHAGLLAHHAVQKKVQKRVGRARILGAGALFACRIERPNRSLVVNRIGAMQMALPVVSVVAVEELEAARVRHVDLIRWPGRSVRLRVQRQAEQRSMLLSVAIGSLLYERIQKMEGRVDIRSLGRLALRQRDRSGGSHGQQEFAAVNGGHEFLLRHFRK